MGPWKDMIIWKKKNQCIGVIRDFCLPSVK